MAKPEVVSGVYASRKHPDQWIVETTDGKLWIVSEIADSNAWRQRKPFPATRADHAQAPDLEPPLGGVGVARLLARNMGLELDPAGRMGACPHTVKRRLYSRAPRKEGGGFDAAAWQCSECGAFLRGDGTLLYPVDLPK